MAPELLVHVVHPVCQDTWRLGPGTETCLILPGTFPAA